MPIFWCYNGFLSGIEEASLRNSRKFQFKKGQKFNILGLLAIYIQLVMCKDTWEVSAGDFKSL